MPQERPPEPARYQSRRVGPSIELVATMEFRQRITRALSYARFECFDSSSAESYKSLGAEHLLRLIRGNNFEWPIVDRAKVLLRTPDFSQAISKDGHFLQML